MTSETVADKSFLGVPVKGDVKYGKTRPDQKPLEDIAPLFKAVIDDPMIHTFGWSQYTPYFNDGEPCIFGIQTPWFRTVNDAEDADTYDLEVDYGKHPTLGQVHGDHVGQYPNREFVESGYEGDHENTYRACRALNAAIGSGSFHDVLQKNFGDHARITVTRDGIDVEFYEHD